MDIKIRNVDPKTVQKMDEFAEKRHLSRNEYLRLLLETYSAIREFKSFEDRYQELVLKLLLVIENDTKALQENTKCLQQIQEMIL